MQRATGKKHHNKKNIQALAESLSKKCKFSRAEIETLLLSFREVTDFESRHPKDKIDRTKFRDLLHNYFHIMDDVILDRVFKSFDQDNDSYISQEEWVKGLSVFVSGTLEEKCKFCFNVYDLNGNGYITKEEMFQLLKNSMVKQQPDEDPDEGVRDLVDIVLKKMDTEHKVRVSLEEFTQTVKQEGLLLEAFGVCLPSDKCCENFYYSFTDDNERKRMVKCAKNGMDPRARSPARDNQQQIKM